MSQWEGGHRLGPARIDSDNVDEGWYIGLVGDTAYDKLLDVRRKH